MRDTSIIVSPDRYRAIPSDTAWAIPFMSIKSITHEGTGMGRGGGALIGLGAGCGVALGGCAYAAKERSELGVGFALAYGPYLAGLGGAIGYLIASPDSDYDPWYGKDLIALRNFSRYPEGEPLELQRIP